MTAATAAPAAAKEASAFAPLGRRAFAVLWVATIISNVGTWMNDVGAGWLMTELSPSPLVVAAVQAATTAPVFLFALLAGAVADIVDRRKLLIVVNLFMAVAATALAALVAMDAVTPALLILFTFLLGAGAAFVQPAWSAIVPQLVEKSELSSAVALNSMGINVSRAIGPALAGFLIVAVGLYAPFALNALSFVCIIAALVWWRPPPAPARKRPPEHVGAAIQAGLRYAVNSGPMRATLIRAAAFFASVSAFWAMLPLIARETLQGGPSLYGVMLAAVGAGAVGGALLLPKIKAKLGADRMVAAGTIGAAVALLLHALVPIPAVAVGAAALAGVAWIAVLSSLNVSAQTALPDWVRARGLSIFLTVFFGCMAAGSLIWGKVASLYGIPTALTAAAILALLLIPVSWRAKLGGGAALDHAPSAHWPEPLVAAEPDGDIGPVTIEIRYRVAAERRDDFLD
ncbi:MAG: MFS transporter, partial [Pseudomonadota bacterium]